MSNVFNVEVIFTCPTTEKRVVVDGGEMYIMGHCANEEHPSDHDIEFHCPSCGYSHTVGQINGNR